MWRLLRWHPAAAAAPGGGGGAGAFRFVLGGLFGIFAAAEAPPPVAPPIAPEVASPCDCDLGNVTAVPVWCTGGTEADTDRVIVLDADVEDSPYVAPSCKSKMHF